MPFSKDFVWGAAAASYQIEGAWNQDGKGLSVCDTWVRRPGAIWSGHTGDVACDHYHRYKQDVALMKQLGLKAYRLSISWPRVIPAGTGPVNEKGLAFYDALVNELLAAGITPYITLFHWDYPYELYLRGGWMNPDSPQWFADYARVLMDRLSDRVRHWITLNEPQCFIGLGHIDGSHAPGDRVGWATALRGAHNALLAHGRAVQAIRAYAKQKPLVGYAPVGCSSIPASDSAADIATARESTFAVPYKTQWTSSWWMDPVYLGRYPEEGLKTFGSDAPPVGPKDMEIIRQPLDFFGFNLYQSGMVKAGADGKPEAVAFAPGHPHTMIRWPISPSCLYWAPRFFYERYKLPIVITENGVSCHDWVSLDGKVHDPQRIDFLHRYLREYRRAADESIPLHGYFVWSIMDNFEWAEGYRERFGLIHVAYTTQKRTPKDSYYWYADVIRANGTNL